MRKLIAGIVDFRKRLLPDYREMFARLALGQQPDALFVACSDSRVVPNLFASSDPGDLFVIRNVGNLIPVCGDAGVSESDESEAAAIEFALTKLTVRDIIVCGHSECGAMMAIAGGRAGVDAPHLRSWLRHGEAARLRFETGVTLDPALSRHNQISQLNVLLQLEHLRTYPVVADAVEAGRLQLHAWWFDIARADVYAYVPRLRRFVVIDEATAPELSL